MRVYIAGSYHERFRIADEANRLFLYGNIVLGRWWDDNYFLEHPCHSPLNMNGDVAEVMGIVDLHYIREADTTIVDTLGYSSTGGREVEFGYALALGKRIIHIGPNLNVFHQLAKEQYDTWDEYVHFGT